MKRRLGVLFLILIMCISMVPAYKGFAAEDATFEVEATIFTKAKVTDLEIQEGTGWFAGSYEIEASDLDNENEEELSNGIKKYKVAFKTHGNYREGQKIKFSLLGVQSDYVEATVVRNKSGNLGVKFILKEKNLVSKSHKITLSSDEPGGLSSNNASSILFSLNFNGIPKKLEATKHSDSEYIFQESLDIDDDGKPIDNQLSNGDELVGQILNLGRGGSDREYKIVKASRTEDDYNLTLKKIELENRKVKVVLDTEMGLAVGPEFKFECAGKVIDKTVNTTEKYGPHEFDVLLENIPKGEDVKVSKLPDSMEYFYKIVDQQYDRDKDELRVKLGRNIAIIISDAKDGVKYDNFAIAHHESGFSFKIFDAKGEKLLGESKNANVFGVGNVNFFYGLLPGDYIVRIDKVPDKFKDFDTSRDYKLHIAKDGKPTMEIYQEQGYAYANPYGGIDKGRFDDSVLGKMLSGTKTPFLLLINKKSQDKKVIIDNENKTELYQTQKNIGDEVEYKITRSISPDHNFVFRFDKYVNVGAKTDLSFDDALDKRLEYIDGSLYIKVDGKPSDEFEAEFDKNANKIVVQDKSKTDLVKFDFNKATKLPANKTLEVGFRAKVKSFGKENQSIYNSFGTTTEITPNIELKCNKKWYGGSELLNNLDPEKFIENFVIEGYFGGEKIATYDVKDYLKPESLVKKDKSKDFSFTVYRLPKYTEDELKKAENQRKAIEYRIVEKQNDLSKKFEQIVHKSNPLTINNVFKSEKVNINIFKRWELSETEKGKEESYMPVFTLSQTNSKNKDVKEYTFSKEKAELIDSNGKTFKYEIFENAQGKIQKVEKTPSVSYENGCYKIKDLPKTGPNGEEYIYAVKEGKVIKNGKDVTTDFTIEGNSEKLVKDEVTGEYSKTITNKEKPYVELNCNKKWYGGSEFLNNLDPEKFIENFVIEGYFGGEKIATYDVKDYLKPESLVKKDKSKDFSFTVYRLPKYTEDELKKAEEQRTPIEYRIVEKQNDLSNKFEQIVHKSNPLTINNVFKSEKVNINIFKRWELSENEKGKEESYVPVFTLSQTNSKNKDVKEYTFSKEKAELFDSNGKTFKYEIFEDAQGKIQKVEKTPSVSYENGCYKIKDLPKTGPNGEEYIYAVKEGKVIKNGKNVTTDFTIEGNSEKLVKDEATGEYSKTITNKEKPYVPPEKPKSPNTGDENYMTIIGLLISAILYGGRLYLAKRK